MFCKNYQLIHLNAALLLLLFVELFFQELLQVKPIPKIKLVNFGARLKAGRPSYWITNGFKALQMLYGCIENIYTVSQKNCAELFLSELCQISTNCENFWHKDGRE